MKELVCLSHAPWGRSPTRTQQLLTRLKEVRILFFEPANDSRRKERRVRPNIVTLPLPSYAIRREPGRFIHPSHPARLSRYLSKTLEAHRFREPTLWLNSPHFFFLVDRLPHRGLVYDCGQEWDDLPLDWESELALRADVVFAASDGLAQRLSPCCDNIAIVPNGVNYPMFARPSSEVPPPLAGVRGPILGRVGAVTADLELEPLLTAAGARPQWNFLLVGPVEDGPRQLLSRYPNIILTGRVPAPDVPDFLCRCNVLFDLLSHRGAGGDILPAHLYEYLAVGKPIVTMIVPDQIEPFPDVAYTAVSPAAFLRLCEKALNEAPDWLLERRRAYAREAQWSARAREVQQILETGALL